VKKILINFTEFDLRDRASSFWHAWIISPLIII